MSELETNQNGINPEPTGDTPILEKHKHVIAIVAVSLATLLAGVFFYNYTATNWFGNEEVVETSTPLATIEPINTIVCEYASDFEAYDDAINKKDLNTCSCIKGAEKKNTCEVNLKDILAYDSALRQMDASLCENITIESRKIACQKLIASSVTSLENDNPQYLAERYTAAHNEKAISEYEKLLEEDSANIDNLIALTLMYAEKGLKEQEQGRDQTPYVEKALATIEKAKTLDEKNSEVYRAMAYVYEIKPELERALFLYGQALALDTNNIAAYAGRGHTERMLGLLDNALQDFLQAAELDTQKSHVYIYTNLCTLEYSKGNIAEAEKYCNIVVESNTVDSVFKSEALQTLSVIGRNRGEYEQAGAYLMEALTLTPKDANLFITLSKLNIYEEKYQEAESNARKAVELSPTKTFGYLALAQALYMEGKFQESIQTAEQALKLVEGDVSLLTPSKPATKRDIYALLSFNYRELEDNSNQEKFEQLSEEALRK